MSAISPLEKLRQEDNKSKESEIHRELEYSLGYILKVNQKEYQKGEHFLKYKSFIFNNSTNVRAI